MTKNQREEIKRALINKGITNAEYKRGSFYLCDIYRKRRELYITENNPKIGFYGCDYETMRQWADNRVKPWVREKFTGWEYFRLKTEKPKGERAVWFNLRRNGWEGEWFDKKDAVIDFVVELYKWLEDCGIMEDTFDATNFELEVGSQHAETSTNDEPGLEDNIGALLISNLQVILTGAPGTGKTYTAREVAKVMVGAMVSKDAPEGEKEKAKKAEEERIASVQFHPGYDYSDFVIGMKPVLVSGKGKEVFRQDGKLYTKDDNDPNGKGQEFKGTTSVSYDWKDGVFKQFAARAKKAYDEAADPEQAPKFVFLIDEINRADLSRVFGELFSLLEEEYRYPKNKNGIRLPNGESFVIPENLYIIGTMNDIDRSVESMDFALRRRFAWREVKASETRDAILGAKNDDGSPKIALEYADELREKMIVLNKKISGEEHLEYTQDGSQATINIGAFLGSAYELGAAIFAKFAKCKGDFTMLWENHIKIILTEYLRGRRDHDVLLVALEKVYNEAKAINAYDGDDEASDVRSNHGRRPVGDFIIKCPDRSEISSEGGNGANALIDFLEYVAGKIEGGIQKIADLGIRRVPDGGGHLLLVKATNMPANIRNEYNLKRQISGYCVLRHTDNWQKVDQINKIIKEFGLEGYSIQEVAD